MMVKNHTVTLSKKLLLVISIKVFALLFLLFYIMPPKERPNPRNEFGTTNPIKVNVVGADSEQTN